MKKYPKYLPPIPLYSNREICLKCEHVTPLFQGEPDINYCHLMANPEYSIDRLNEQQRERFFRSDIKKILCPLYKPKSKN